MWTMMGYSDSMPDSFNGRKLRPLVPRPLSNSANNNNPNTPTLPCLHATQLFSLNHHHLGSHFGEQNKREFNTAAPVVLSSSRWNPTPEQLRILEELYRRGTRTPSADQIQHITAQLRRYGKIEGKNVFYWFQNHKARERQKRRRQMESSASHDLNLNDVVENLQRNKASSGTNRTAYEVEQTKSNRAAPTNCSTLSEVRTTRKGCRCGCGLIQLDEPDLQRRDFVGRNATWQHMMMMHQVSCPKLKSSMENQQEVKMTKKNTLPPRHHHPQELNIFITPYSSYTKQNDAAFTVELQEEEEEEEDYSYSGESHDQTLELFPLRSGDAFHNSFDKITVDPHFQFFEFLPLKE